MSANNAIMMSLGTHVAPQRGVLPDAVQALCTAASAGARASRASSGRGGGGRKKAVKESTKTKNELLTFLGFPRGIRIESNGRRAASRGSSGWLSLEHHSPNDYDVLCRELLYAAFFYLISSRLCFFFLFEMKCDDALTHQTTSDGAPMPPPLRNAWNDNVFFDIYVYASEYENFQDIPIKTEV